MKKMTRKRFKKLLMSRGVSRNNAQWLIDYLTEVRHEIERPYRLVATFSSETGEFRLAQAYPYAQVHKSFVEDGELLV